MDWIGLDWLWGGWTRGRPLIDRLYIEKANGLNSVVSGLCQEYGFSVDRTEQKDSNLQKLRNRHIDPQPPPEDIIFSSRTIPST